MNECEETEEGVHPSETPLCGQHDNQTKAQSRPDVSDSLFSHPLKKVATADGDSVLSSYSGLGSGESLSSDLNKNVAISDDSSDDGCVSRKEKARSYHCDIDFKKNPDHKSSFRPVSLPVWPDSSESLFSHSLKDVATADGDSVWSLDSGISLERKVSSGFSCESGKKEKEKTTPPTIQEFVVGSSAGIET